jgi:hypothetical protein
MYECVCVCVEECGVKYKIKHISSVLRILRICAVAINICASLMILQ